MGNNKTHQTYSISLLFDQQSSLLLNKIISIVASFTKNSYHLNMDIPPHITIGMFKAKDNKINDKDTFVSTLSPILDTFSSFDLSLSNIDILKDKVLIGKFSNILMLKKLNEESYQLLKYYYESCCNNQYVPLNFYPHITFATGLSKTQIKAIENYCSSLALPKNLKIEHIVLAVKNPYTPFYIK